MAPGIIAVDIRNRSTLMKSDWFGTAISHPGFMHSLLCTAALHLYIFGRGSIETILCHRAQSIASINAAISNSDLTVGISDANIGAVFNLLTVEEALLLPFFEHAKLEQDQSSQRGIHLHGLRRMIQLRGGLIAIHSNRILQAFILWYVTPGPHHEEWPEPVWYVLTEHQAFDGSRYCFLRSAKRLHFGLHQHGDLSSTSPRISGEYFTTSYRLLPTCRCQELSHQIGRISPHSDRRPQRLVQ